MAGTTTVFPEERILALRPVIEMQLKDAAARVGDATFDEFFEAPLRALLIEAFNRVGAHEGSVWLLDEAREFLVPRYNSGPNAARFVNTFRQSVRSGMISMVVATEQPICENGMCEHPGQDRALNEMLRLEACAMLAVPFSFLGELRGVISCVQLKALGSPDPDPPGFSPDALRALQSTAGLLSRLVEHRLFTLCLGLEGIV